MGTEHNTVDILVIGAGASGGAFTWSLSKAGLQVMCLEQGGWVQPKAYPTTKDDWELHRLMEYNADPNIRNLPQDYPVNNSSSPIAPLMYNAVGGSTIHWSAHFPRFHPSDFQVRTLDAVAEDWPISYKQLEPFFDLNDEMVGVSGITGDPAYPPKSDRQTPPIPLGKLGNTIVGGFEKLGWHWWPSDSAIITKAYDGRTACNNCGPCDIGCYQRAKASSDITYWPKAIQYGAILKTHTTVREITVGKNGKAGSVIYYDQNGDVQEQKARIIVLACNGIGTPRLLLNSVSTVFPDGLANSSGLVGKNLMFHPYGMTTGVFEDFLEGYKGPIGCSIISQEFYETNVNHDFVRGYSFQVIRSSGPAHTAISGIGGHPVPWGQDHHRVFSARFGRTITIATIGEDLPELHNQVSLDPNLSDSHGIPAPKVEYTLSENSRKLLAHGSERATEVLKAAGAKEILINPLLRTAGWHLMGTAKMGVNSNNSVVNNVGRSHDVKNLFIIDGSIFVTGGAVNPTSTIQAIALFVANHIKNNARHLLD